MPVRFVQAAPPTRVPRHAISNWQSYLASSASARRCRLYAFLALRATFRFFFGDLAPGGYTVSVDTATLPAGYNTTPTNGPASRVYLLPVGKDILYVDAKTGLPARLDLQPLRGALRLGE